MRIKKSVTVALIAFIQAGVLTVGTPEAGLAQAPFSATQISKIENAERVLFGSTRGHRSSESRLRAIETNLFGEHNTGTVSSRLSRVDELIGDNKPSVLMPPMAGMYDTGNSSVKEAPSAIGDNHTADADSPAQKLLKEAMSKYSAGDLAGAKTLFLKVTQMDSSNEDAWFNLGVIAESEADQKNALYYYKKASALNPNDSELSQTVISLEAKVKQENEAKIAQQLEEKRKQKEAQDLAWMKKTVADASKDYKSGNYDNAVRKLESVASKAPTDPDVQFALGQAHRAKGNLPEAKTAFQRAASLDPSSNLYKGAVQEVNGDMYSTNSSAPPVAQDTTPPGKITPFTPVANAPRSRSIARKVFSGSRVKRAIAGGVMGAASGAVWSATTKRSSIKSGALQGALMGSLVGYLSGN